MIRLSITCTGASLCINDTLKLGLTSGYTSATIKITGANQHKYISWQFIEFCTSYFKRCVMFLIIPIMINCNIYFLCSMLILKENL